MTGMATTSGEAQQLQENWSNIISQKEDEINKLRERHVADLEERLLTKESEVVELEVSYKKLKDDFEYNLEVLQERDKDLKEYDDVLVREMEKGQDRSRMIDETRKIIEKLQFELQSEREARVEEQSFCKQKMFELKEEAENAKYGREEAVLRQKEDFERVRRCLQKEIDELKGEKELQNHNLRSEFSGQIQRLESELRLQKQESAHCTTQLEDKLESVESELQKTKESERHKAESLSRALATSAEHERVTRAVSFEFEEWKISKEKVIVELESKLQATTTEHHIYVNNSKAMENKLSMELLDLQNVGEQLQDTYRRRLEQEHAGLLSERDTFKFRTEAAEERLKTLEEELQGAQSAHKIEERDMRERISKLELEKNEALQNLNSTAQEITSKYHAEIRLLKEELWSKNEEISVLRTKESNMKTSLDDRRGDINSYKEQLASSIERERELKRSLRALELKAELDLQANEAKVSASNENVVKQLTQDKDYSSEKLRQCEERILQQEEEIAALRKESTAGAQQQQPTSRTSIPENWSPDSSLLGLNLNLSDISPTMSLNTPGKPDLVVAKLREMESENMRLKDVIAALRQEMESVAPVADEGKLKALERELSASDSDYQQAMNHVRILQSRDAGDSDLGSRNRAELEFLRNQAAKILQENRSMRRLQVMNAQATTGGGEVDSASTPAPSPSAGDHQASSASAYNGQERLLIYSKLVDMRNELSPKSRWGQVTRDDENNNMVIGLADDVADLVRRSCRRLAVKSKNLKRVIEERDRILELNNALRSSIDKKNLDESNQGSGIPSLLDHNATTERLLETNEKLSYVQNSLVDLKQQSEELIRYQREAQKIVSPSSEEATIAAKSQRPRTAHPSTSKAKAKAANDLGAPGSGSERVQERPKTAKVSKSTGAPSTSRKGLKLTGERAPSSAPSARCAQNQATASQRARLQALALKRQRKERESQKPQIRNYNIRDDGVAAKESAALKNAEGG